MKKSPFMLMLFFVAIAGPSFAAETGMDYLCLDQCMKDGKTSTVCLPKCTRNQQSGKQARISTHTDYRCLTLCMKDGKASGECMPKCTYAATPKKTASNIAGPPMAGMDPTVSANKVLKAPIPAGDMLYMPSHAGDKNRNAGKDYACIAQCLRDGMQYQLCNLNCAEVTPEFNKAQ